MVVHVLFQQVAQATFADERTKSALEQMDPPRRAAVMMTILGLVLLGLGLMFCVMIGGRWVRRLARHNPRPLAGQDSATRLANHRLRQSLDRVLPVSNTSATVQIDASTDETKVDRPANE